VSPDPMRSKQEAKKRGAEQEKELIKLSLAYREVFEKTEEGRMVYKDLLEFCKVFETTMTGNSWTYFEEGKRAVGLHIFHMREYGAEQEVNLLRNQAYKTKSEEE
jgi:hypothetical protein